VQVWPYFLGVIASANFPFFTALKQGSSGAWVIDEETHELYGHIVASDIFGRGYVVPSDDVFQDIKAQLAAKSITLPLSFELGASNFKPDVVHESSRPVSPDLVTSSETITEALIPSILDKSDNKNRIHSIFRSDVPAKENHDDPITDPNGRTSSLGAALAHQQPSPKQAKLTTRPDLPETESTMVQETYPIYNLSWESLREFLEEKFVGYKFEQCVVCCFIRKLLFPSFELRHTIACFYLSADIFFNRFKIATYCTFQISLARFVPHLTTFFVFSFSMLTTH
jgi:hypothetical protein